MRRTLLGASLACAALMLAGCAAPGSDTHLQVGSNPRQGTVAVLLWVPDAHRKQDIWLQFERRNAQGQPTGIPISVAVGSDSGPSTGLPQRPGLQARVAAVPLDAGGYFLSRWVAAIDPARSAISPWIGWGFEVEAGQAVHMGRLELSLQPVQVQEVAFRLGAATATAADLSLMKSWLPATAAMRWRSIPWPAGQVATGAATISGTVTRTINNSPGVYIR